MSRLVATSISAIRFAAYFGALILCLVFVNDGGMGFLVGSAAMALNFLLHEVQARFE